MPNVPYSLITDFIAQRMAELLDQDITLPDTVRILIEEDTVQIGRHALENTSVRETSAEMAESSSLADHYISVPTPTEAIQYTEANKSRVYEWLDHAGQVWWVDRVGALRVMTPQGSKPINFGDYVVRGVIGEFYPVAEVVFNRKYTPRRNMPNHSQDG